ncbi:hypothetical protein D7Z94_01550 [Ulvibacterium marinum]|uniref:Magnesium citrate secondary transporter n=2 Tax=Ulvibacterium marinum TaxID=2419782 RepID=A0A3B0CD59_9FLAO|nr:hypothetical protein D7Z94_01550 [Ulvibacterium marinum]
MLNFEKKNIKTTPKRLKAFYFPLFCSMALIVFSLQKMSATLPEWTNNYLNDFLCMPIVLFMGQFAIRKLKGNNTLRLPWPLILTLTLFYSVYFEYYLPRINLRYTADFLDVVLYFSGSAFFYLMENKLTVQT